jgi:hypothetical protein
LQMLDVQPWNLSLVVDNLATSQQDCNGYGYFLYYSQPQSTLVPLFTIHSFYH